MKIVGLMACRNEDWCLGLTARAALMWLDELVILDHASTDASLDIEMEIAEEFPGRVTIIAELNTRWEEMRHRQRMLDEARKLGATHIAYVDADEVLTSNLLPGHEAAPNLNIRVFFERTHHAMRLQIPWLAMRGSIGRVHTSGPWSDHQNVTTGWIDAPGLHWSSEKRGGYDFHHREPMGSPLVPFTPLGASRKAGLMHLQFVSQRRLRAKQAWYKVQEVLRWPGREPDQVRAVDERYNLAVYGQYQPRPDWDTAIDATISTAPMAEWWDAYAPLMKHLKPHALPWQEAEVNKALAEHGPARFAGLDLFGIGETPVHVKP